MNIGILGSSFNPIHIAHLVIAEEARKRFNLDKVLFIPTKNPYHKDVDLLDFETRIEMVEETIKNNKYFEVSDIEKNIDGNSYSIDVINLLRKEYPNDKFYFIIGSDSFFDLTDWKDYTEFIKLVNILVFIRPGYNIPKKIIKIFKLLFEPLSLEIDFVDDLQMQVSSTYIRNSIKEGYMPKYLLHENTIKFLEGKKLW